MDEKEEEDFPESGFPEPGRMYDIAEDFVKAFGKTKILKQEASSTRIRNPITKEYTDVASLFGFLVAGYVRLTDAVSDSKRSDLPSGERVYFLTLARANRSDMVLALNDTIQFAYAHNLIEDVSDREFDKLRDENAELRERMEELQRDLKKCQDDFTAYRNLVLPRKEKGQEGDVVST